MTTQKRAGRIDWSMPSGSDLRQSRGKSIIIRQGDHYNLTQLLPGLNWAPSPLIVQGAMELRNSQITYFSNARESWKQEEKEVLSLEIFLRWIVACQEGVSPWLYFRFLGLVVSKMSPTLKTIMMNSKQRSIGVSTSINAIGWTPVLLKNQYGFLNIRHRRRMW